MEKDTTAPETKWEQLTKAKKEILSTLCQSLLKFNIAPRKNDKIEKCSLSLVTYNDDYPFSKTIVELDLT